MPRDNLLNSACLEFFECIKRDANKSIIKHLGDLYRDRLQLITYVDTFQTILIRYDQIIHPEMDTTLFSNDNDSATGHFKANGNHRWQGVKEMDPAEEAYFNTSDDEDEIASSTKKKPLQNGSSPLLKSLVDYPDDDEDAMDTIKPSPSDPHSTPSSIKSENNQTRSYSPISILPSSSPPSANLATTLPQTPPERLSEKRRREEDDEEDELGKLALTKRRSSSGGASSVPNSITGQSSLLRRKKGFALSNSSKDSSTGAKKIEISLASLKSHTEPDPKRDEGG